MRQRRLKNEINVVPYIDVMLVLLVIFMVATPMMTTGSVELPSTGTAPQKPDKYYKIQIESDGVLTFFDTDGKERKLRDLRQLREHLSTLKKEDAVLIAGDKAVQYQRVIEALDEVKKQGFSRVGLETGIK